MSSWDEIRFDMSRDGLIELECALTCGLFPISDELQNFANEIRAMAQKAPAVKQESSWLDE